ncbi:hypothetical protein OV203_01255 [Nannocystis sp. ILAH1]|uniref:hypothetical protein n=1 Tax=Nannocystis sp. ILAH1 TaxID=2996789 RepID=UPI00226E0626|nr:hypothetical protein [Nannocystis sp. ILAH1]MCY0985737.1 hypothetical protein [Nannocystis sp. ILAH1]
MRREPRSPNQTAGRYRPVGVLGTLSSEASMSDARIPYTKIRDAQDRSWTERLLSRFGAEDLEGDQRDEIATTLEILADPRAEAPLAAILADRARPEMLRRAAAWILRSSGAVERGTLPALLRDGDRVEQSHALLAMDYGYAELVAAIAEAPGHPLHCEAIQTMAWDFESPRFQTLKIAALAHADGVPGPATPPGSWRGSTSERGPGRSPRRARAAAARAVLGRGALSRACA